jgi:hypothetical protein
MQEILEISLLIFVLLCIVALLPIAALVNVIRRTFKNDYEKLMWVLVVIFMNPVGPVLYFLLGKHKTKEGPSETIEYFPKDLV